MKNIFLIIQGCICFFYLSSSFALNHSQEVENPEDIVETLYLTETGAPITPDHCGTYNELVINYSSGIANFTTEFYRPSYCLSSKIKVPRVTWIFKLDRFNPGYNTRGSFDIPLWGSGTINIFDIRDMPPALPSPNVPTVQVKLVLPYFGTSNYSGPVEFNP